MTRDELMAAFPGGGTVSDARKAHEAAVTHRCPDCGRTAPAHCICAPLPAAA